MGRFVSGEFVSGRAIDIAVLLCMIIVRHSSSPRYLAEKVCVGGGIEIAELPIISTIGS